ncbi:hypothetical protein EVAR_5513_1 [Eumeta japonica]|uniref:Uncharacterized protein n=1 Tax=Eumeta variegata TaxID=151549 RepID=A0A4C1T940_EUMVA|nr:hypothetical protein EVAR_5513_1 [Eumeta japonica]
MAVIGRVTNVRLVGFRGRVLNDMIRWALSSANVPCTLQPPSLSRSGGTFDPGQNSDSILEFRRQNLGKNGNLTDSLCASVHPSVRSSIRMS